MTYLIADEIVGQGRRPGERELWYVTKWVDEEQRYRWSRDVKQAMRFDEAGAAATMLILEDARKYNVSGTLRLLMIDPREDI